MKKKLTRGIKMVILGAAAAVLMAGCNGGSGVTEQDTAAGSDTGNNAENEKTASGKAEFVFKFGYAADENNTWHKGAEKFAEEVAEKSGGRIEIKLYPNEQLGSEVDNVTAIQAGTADMVLSGETLQNWAEKVGIMSTPYLIRDSEHMKNVIEGEAGQILEQEISDLADLHVLTYFERGPRMLTSNKPINNMSDLQGLKLRIPNVPLFVEVWNEWGAKPTPMAFSEVFTSLQQNTIEAQENPLALMNSGGFYEVQKYVNNTHHVRGWIYMLIGNEQWSRLPDELKTVMEEAAKAAQEHEHELFLADEEEIKRSLLEDKGMEWVETDTSEMESGAEAYYNEKLSDSLLELYNMIKSIQ